MLLALTALASEEARAVSVYTEDDYTQVYDLITKNISYTDAQGNQATKVVTGYHGLYDYDDPIIRCGMSSSSGCTYNATYTQNFNIGIELSRYKFYLPKGLTTLQHDILLSSSSDKYVLYMRLGQPPQCGVGCDSTAAQALTDQLFNSVSTAPVTMAQLKAQDCLVRNSSIVLSPLTGSFTEQTKGEWLYVVVLKKSGAIINLSITSTIQTVPFMDWFRNQDWSVFGHTNIPILTPIPTPTQTPTPTPITTPEPKVTPQVLNIKRNQPYIFNLTD